MSVLKNLKTSEFVNIRRIIHQTPELAFHEFETAKFIAEYLEELGIPKEEGIAGTGVVGFIEAPFATQTLLIRAEMDAVAVTEKTNLPHASRRGGIMHSCGHDAHIAMLLGAARNLVAEQHNLKTNVKLVFQPAEESEEGANAMVEAGVMEGVTTAIALHVHPGARTNEIILKKGEMMAANDKFEIALKGIGGQDANPVQNSSLTYVTSQIVNNLYSLIPRRFYAHDSALLSVCAVECGHAYNVMPSTATIRGSIRTYSDEVRELIPVYIEQIVGCMSAAYDIDSKVKFTRGNAPVINDDIMIDRAAKATIDVGHVIYQPRPSMGSDDFSAYSSRVPSCYVRIGCAPPGQREPHSLHSEYFDIDENCIQVGIDFLTNFAMQA